MGENRELHIRPIKLEDLNSIWQMAFKDSNPEWKLWDAPYFPHHAMSYDDFLLQKDDWINVPNRWAVIYNNEVIGTVSYYWEHEPSKWLEMGISIYQSDNWSKGIGTNVMRMWIDHLFNTLDIVRVGYTTWSGNKGMIKIGERLGMTMEARIRKVRYYNGTYYDSIRMGLLREEWQDLKS